jgi:hypothetical protein
VARKDLSRTVIEGGRYYHNSFFRRASHGVARARTRTWIDRVRADLEDAEASAPVPGPRVHKMFRDKLGPALRWLHAQVGRPWAAVFSDVCARFDTRTVAGRHVVYDHMLRWIDTDGGSGRAWPHTQFVIDAAGFLRRDRRATRAWQLARGEALAWASGRRAVLEFRGWWWYRFDPKTICNGGWTCKEQHVTGYGPRVHALRLVSESPLTRGDLRRLRRLPSELRAEIVLDTEGLVSRATR